MFSPLASFGEFKTLYSSGDDVLIGEPSPYIKRITDSADEFMFIFLKSPFASPKVQQLLDKGIKAVDYCSWTYSSSFSLNIKI